jgi:hypothetical protein
MKLTFTKRFKHYAVGDSDTFPEVEAKGLIALGLAEEAPAEPVVAKKGKDQVTE